MKSYSSKEVITMLKQDGWFQVGQKGSHHQFKHSIKNGKVTVAHPEKDLDISIIKSIAKQSGLTF